jgi:hypothetical protein
MPKGVGGIYPSGMEICERLPFGAELRHTTVSNIMI